MAKIVVKSRTLLRVVVTASSFVPKAFWPSEQRLTQRLRVCRTGKHGCLYRLLYVWTDLSGRCDRDLQIRR